MYAMCKCKQSTLLQGNNYLVLFLRTLVLNNIKPALSSNRSFTAAPEKQFGLAWQAILFFLLWKGHNPLGRLCPSFLAWDIATALHHMFRGHSQHLGLPEHMTDCRHFARYIMICEILCERSKRRDETPAGERPALLESPA